MANFIVTSLSNFGVDATITGTLADEIADGNGLSLAEAILFSEANDEADTITFSDALRGRTLFSNIVNNISVSYEINASEGLTIIGSLSVDGMPEITLESSNRFFDIGLNANVIIQGIALSGGYGPGPSGFPPLVNGVAVGAILNEGNLTLLDVVIENAITRFRQVDGQSANPGQDGVEGAMGILGNTPSPTFSILLGGEFIFSDGSGFAGTDGFDAFDAGDGTANDATLIYNTGTLTLDGVTFRDNVVEASAGDGGDGGRGGRGGDGGQPATFGGMQGAGGNGGNGSDGGDGAQGGDASAILNTGALNINDLIVDNNTITGADGGDGGDRGAAGQPGLSNTPTGSALGGAFGLNGADGAAGDGGDGVIVLNRGGTITGSVATNSDPTGGQGGLPGSYIPGGVIVVGSPVPGTPGFGGVFLNENGGTGTLTVSDILVLEARSLLVTTTLDVVDAFDGVTSLREAIAFANETAGIDTISFASAAGDAFESGGLIRLTQGELLITEALTIDGQGLVTITGDANGDDALVAGTNITDVAASLNGQDLLVDNSRVLNIQSSAGGVVSGEVTLSGLTITGGRTTEDGAKGGGVRSVTSSLVIEDSEISGNSTSGNIFAEGGGVFSNGNLTISDSLISGNGTSGSLGRGGGISSLGSLTVSDTVISNNSTSGDNSQGGGIFGGGINLTNSAVSGNSTFGSNSSGGGVSSFSTLTSVNSTFEGNSTNGTASSGGAIFSMGLVNADMSTLSGNTTAGSGGAIYGRNAISLTSSTVDGNTAGGPGGGIYSAQSVSATNSTFSGNATVNNFGNGGAIFSLAGVTLTHATVTGNLTLGAVANGGGVFSRGDIALTNSILLGNSALQSEGDEFFETTFTGQNNLTTNTGLNIVGVGTDTDASDGLVNANAEDVFANTLVLTNGTVAGALADNGGPVQTVALLAEATNLALDASGPSALATDARGELALDQTNIGAEGAVPGIRDLGAYELTAQVSAPAEPPTISIAPESLSLDEGDSGPTVFTFTITRTGDTSGESSVGFNVGPTGANPVNGDIAVGAGGSIIFAAGETTKTITVTTTGDTEFEPDEQFSVSLVNPVNAVIDNAVAIGTILNDDLPANTAPVALDDAILGDEDTVIVGDVLADNFGGGPDSDADGDTLTATLVTGTANGTVTLNPDGTFSYTPNANFNGEDTFTYVANDGTIDSAPATVTITVRSINDAPVGVTTIAATDEDTVLSGTLVGSDVDGDDLTFALNASPANGSVDILPGGTFTYTPDTDFNGEDTFRYTLSDGIETILQTVTVSVGAANDAPVALDDDDAGATDEDTAFTTANVLVNDTDPDVGDTLTVTSIDTTGTLGLVTDNGDGTFGYDPNGQFESLNDGETATDSFIYTISDGNGGTDTAAVTVTINGVTDVAPNRDPVVTGPLAVSLSEDDASTSLDLLAGAFDPDADILSLSNLVVDGDNRGVALVENSLSIDPSAYGDLNDGEFAAISYTFDIIDGNGGSVSQTAIVTINGVTDQVPSLSLVIDPLSVSEGGAASATITRNNSDLSSALIVSLASSDATEATVVPTVTIAAGEASATFAVTALTDGIVDGNQVAMIVALADGFTGVEASINVVDVDVVSPDFNIVEATQVKEVLVGTAANDAFIFTPGTSSLAQMDVIQDWRPGDVIDLSTLGLTAADLQTRTISSGTVLKLIQGFGPSDFQLKVELNGNSVQEILDSIIFGDGTPVNIAPTANPDRATTEIGAFVDVDALANDTDLENDPLSVESFTQGANGSVVDLGGGVFRYTPDAGISGVDNFNYTISDGQGNFATSTVTVTVGQLPGTMITATTVQELLNGGEGPEIYVFNPGTSNRLALDTIIDWEPGDLIDLSALGLTVSDISVRTVSGNTVVKLIEGLDDDDFQLKVNLNGFSVEQVLGSIIFGDGTPVNTAPLANADRATTEIDAFVDVDALANDTDLENDPLSVESFTQGANGSVVDLGGGVFRYTPDAGTSGVDNFSYTISDGQGNFATSTVTVTVGQLPGTVIMATSARELLSGGDGPEIYTFNPGTSNRLALDTIIDWEPGDLIDLSALGLTLSDLTVRVVGGDTIVKLIEGFGDDDFQVRVNLNGFSVQDVLDSVVFADAAPAAAAEAFGAKAPVSALTTDLDMAALKSEPVPISEVQRFEETTTDAKAAVSEVQVFEDTFDFSGLQAEAVQPALQPMGVYFDNGLAWISDLEPGGLSLAELGQAQDPFAELIDPPVDFAEELTPVDGFDFI